MASFTPNKGLAQPTVGADVSQWGTELNASMSTLDNNLGGVAPVSLAGASGVVVATTANAQCLVQNFTGALAGNVIYQVPALGGMYICENNTTGAFTVTVETTASGSLGTMIPQGTTVAVFSDGTNVSSQTTPNPGTFSNLTVSGTLGVTGASTFTATATGAAGFVASGTDVGGAGFQFRATSTHFGVGLRNDDTNAYLLQTASGAPLASFNTFRPFTWLLSSGAVTIDATGVGVSTGGALHATGVISTAAGITAALSITATGALSGSSVTSGSSIAATTSVTGANVTAANAVSGTTYITTNTQFTIIGGTSGFLLNNHANSANNLVCDDSGNFSARTSVAAPAINASSSMGTTTLNASGTITGGTINSSGAINSGSTITSGFNFVPGSGGGFSSKAGTAGGLTGNVFNLQWNPGASAVELWIDATPLGLITVSSDERVKDHIEYFCADFVSKVRALNVVSYQFKDSGIFKDSGKRHVGFITQAVQKIIPEAVNGEPDALTPDGEIAPQSLNPIPLIAVNTGAIQQLIARVEALEAALKERDSMYSEGLPEWPSKTVFSWRERLMAKLRRFLKRWRGTPE